MNHTIFNIKIIEWLIITLPFWMIIPLKIMFWLFDKFTKVDLDDIDHYRGRY